LFTTPGPRVAGLTRWALQAISGIGCCPPSSLERACTQGRCDAPCHSFAYTASLLQARAWAGGRADWRSSRRARRLPRRPPLLSRRPPAPLVSALAHTRFNQSQHSRSCVLPCVHILELAAGPAVQDWIQASRSETKKFPGSYYQSPRALPARHTAVGRDRGSFGSPTLLRGWWRLTEMAARWLCASPCASGPSGGDVLWPGSIRGPPGRARGRESSTAI
jgi:hypothetical protein